MCLLLSSGHTDVYRYDWDWFVDCIQAVRRNQAAQQLAAMVGTRYAMHAEKDDWRDECRRLQSEIKDAS